MRRAAALLIEVMCALAALGCWGGGPAKPSGPVNAQIVLAPGETADVPNAALRIRFQGVTGDSRCPADVLCIQGGDAVVHVDVMPSGGSSASYELHTGNMQPVRHGDFTIALTELAPYPFSSRTIAPNEYRATLRVTR